MTQPQHKDGRELVSRAGQASRRRVKAPHYRLAAAIAGAHHRLWQRSGIRNGRVWTGPMSLIAFFGLMAAIAISPLDAKATVFVRSNGMAWIGWMAEVTYVGASQWYLVPAATVFLMTGLADWTRTGMRGRSLMSMLFGQAAFCFAAVAMSGILVNILKVIFGRARPRLFETYGAWHFAPFSANYDFASFPSGHSATLGAVTAILMLWYPRFSLLFVPVGLFFAATRIASRSHFPSDVITGFLIGLLFAVALARFLALRGVVFRLNDEKLLPKAKRLRKK